MRCRGAILALGVLAVSGSPAAAQFREPTDAELRAAYCVGVLQAKVQMAREAEALFRGAASEEQTRSMTQQRIDAEQGLERLRAYLVPKLPYLELISITAARKRADSDYALAKAEGDEIVAACRKTTTNTLDLLKCTTRNTLTDTQVSKRLRRCDDTSWLPF